MRYIMGIKIGAVRLGSGTMTKMTNGESVKLSVLERICKELNCNFADIVDYVDDSKVSKEK